MLLSLQDLATKSKEVDPDVDAALLRKWCLMESQGLCFQGDEERKQAREGALVGKMPM